MFPTKITENINHGGYASWDEICSETAEIDYVNGTATKAGVNVTTNGKQALAHTDDGFHVVVGSTSSGKTSDIVAPYIINNALAGNSMAITDIKGDIYRLVSPMLRKLGYNIRILDFNDPSRGDAYNPILPIYKAYKNGDVDTANRNLNNLAEEIFSCVASEKDPFWHNTSAMYWTGLELTLFDYFSEKDATIANALDLHFQGEKKTGPSSTLMKDFYSGNECSGAWKLIASTVLAPNETRTSIHSVFVSALNRLVGQNASLIKMLSHSTFGAEDLVNEKTAIFIIANEESLSVNRYLISALIHQWYSILVSIADESVNGILKRKVVFILDEFGNLPAIKDFHIKMSLSRARGISWMLILQSLAQMELQYGIPQAHTIIGNVGNWIFLHSPDPQILEYISRISGETTEGPLLTVNQLKYDLKKINKEGKTEVLMMLGRKKPFIAYLMDIRDYYGIEPIDKLDIPSREDPEIEPINFSEIAKKKDKEKKDRMTEEIHALAARCEEKKAKRKIPDIDLKERMVKKVMNNVFNELKGG